MKTWHLFPGVEIDGNGLLQVYLADVRAALPKNLQFVTDDELLPCVFAALQDQYGKDFLSDERIDQLTQQWEARR